MKKPAFLKINQNYVDDNIIIIRKIKMELQQKMKN